MNQTTLPAPGSHFISLTRAIEMTSLFRTEKENILATVWQNKDILPICETFNRFDIDTLLAKQNCQALRVYMGMDEQLKLRVLMVAVNENAEDLLPASSSIASGTLTDDDDIIEEGHRYPPSCPPPSPLNS